MAVAGAVVLGLGLALRCACDSPDDEAAAEQDEAAIVLEEETAEGSAAAEAGSVASAAGASVAGAPSPGESEGAQRESAAAGAEDAPLEADGGAGMGAEGGAGTGPEGAAGMGAEGGAGTGPEGAAGMKAEGADEELPEDAGLEASRLDVGAADPSTSIQPTPLQQDASRLAEGQMTPEELLQAAKEAYAQRNFRDAYRLANKSHYHKPSNEALLLSGKAACELRDKDLAKSAMKAFKLSDPQRKTIREVCQRKGVRVGL